MAISGFNLCMTLWTAQQTENMCMTFVQCWTNVEDTPPLNYGIPQRTCVTILNYFVHAASCFLQHAICLFIHNGPCYDGAISQRLLSCFMSTALCNVRCVFWLVYPLYEPDVMWDFHFARCNAGTVYAVFSTMQCATINHVMYHKAQCNIGMSWSTMPCSLL